MLTRGLGSRIGRNGQHQRYDMIPLSSSFPKRAQRPSRNKYFSFYHQERKSTIKSVFVNIRHFCYFENCNFNFGCSLFLKYSMLGQALWHEKAHTYRETNYQVAFNLDSFCLSYAIFSKRMVFFGTPCSYKKVGTWSK